MADQDFQINIRTIADTTGIRLTQQQLEALQQAAAKGNQQAITALKQLTAAQKEAQVAASAGGGLGLGAGLLGGVAAGAVTSAVGFLISQIKALNDDQERMIEQLEKQREKTYELGLAAVDSLDKMRELERINVEPLNQSLDRTAQKVRVFRQEAEQAFKDANYEAFNKAIQNMQFFEHLLDNVQGKLDAQAEAQRRAGRAAGDFARDAQAARERDPTSGMSETEKNRARAAQIDQFAKRKDLTGAEEKALRDASIQTDKDWFSAQKEDQERAAELMRQRQAGPGPGMLRTLDYFTKGPGAPGAMDTQGQKLDEILEFMKQVWGY